MQQEYRLGKQLLEAGHRIRLHINSMFSEDDLTGLQARIIGYVAACEKDGRQIYQKDIESEFKIGRSSVTSVLNNLEKNGFILRLPAEHDARLKRITLTEKALQFGEAHQARLDRFEKNLMEAFSPEELAVVQKVLDRISRDLDPLKEDEQ